MDDRGGAAVDDREADRADDDDDDDDDDGADEKNETVDLDELLPHVGEFGRYQRLMLWLVCLPACVPCGFCAFNQLFMADVPPHWCAVPELVGVAEERRRQLAIPRADNRSWSSCYRYAVNWSAAYVDDGLVDADPSWPVEYCPRGWVYNTTAVSSSIVIDFDLVCDRAIYPTLGLVALNLGGPVGVYLFGWMNDRVGRRISFFSCLATLVVGNVMTAASPSFWWWAGSRVVVGLTIPAVYQIPFIIALELVGPNYRSFVTVMTCIFYTFGLMLLAGVTYLIRDWVQLSLATSAPFVLYSVYWFFLPESPRWLLAQGRLEEASEILETLARINGRELPEGFRSRLRRRRKADERKRARVPGVLDLCQTPNMRLKTALITLNWFANEMVYVGLSYYGPALGSDRYLSFLLSSAVEIPSYIVCWIVMDRWGRRWPLCLCMIVSGVACIVTVLLPADAVTATLVLFLVSKSAISASFLIIYPFAGELYPTQLRGVGIGISAYLAGLGLVLIPFVTYLGSDNLVMPLVIMGSVSVIGGISGLRLPETLHFRLPQTVEEGEQFGKDFDLEDCLRCIPLRPSSTGGSYEDLEMEPVRSSLDEKSPLQDLPKRRIAIRRLVRQSSFMDTQKDHDGAMKMTYWF